METSVARASNAKRKAQPDCHCAVRADSGGFFIVLPAAVVQYRLMNSHGLNRRLAIVIGDPGTLDGAALPTTDRLDCLIGCIVDSAGCRLPRS